MWNILSLLTKYFILFPTKLSFKPPRKLTEMLGITLRCRHYSLRWTQPNSCEASLVLSDVFFFFTICSRPSLARPFVILRRKLFPLGTFVQQSVCYWFSCIPCAFDITGVQHACMHIHVAYVIMRLSKIAYGWIFMPSIILLFDPFGERQKNGWELWHFSSPKWRLN